MNAYTSGFRGSAPLKTYVQIIDSTRPAFLASPLADARGYGSASSSPLVGRQAHGHSLAVAARLHCFECQLFAWFRGIRRQPVSAAVI
jgi:hypothetical protein